VWSSLVNSSLSETDATKELFARLNDYILEQSFTVPIATYPYTIFDARQCERRAVPAP
jgi:hypothetical protein